MFKVIFFALILWRNLSQGKESLALIKAHLQLLKVKVLVRFQFSFAETESTGKGIGTFEKKKKHRLYKIAIVI